MSFSPWHFAVPGIILPLGLIVLFCIAFFLGFRRLILKGHLWRARFLALFSLIAFLVGYFTIARVCLPAMSVVLETNVPVQQTVGTITAVRDGPINPQYYDESTDTLSPAQYITIHDTEFYFPGNGLTVGQRVDIQWATDFHIIKSITTEVSPTTPDGTITVYTPPTEEPPHPEVKCTWANLASFFLVIFILRMILWHLAGPKLAVWLQEQDRRHRQGIIPSRFGLVYFAFTNVPALAMGFCVLAAELAASLLMVSIVGGIWLWILLKKQTTYVTLTGHRIVFREFRKTTQIDLSEIQFIGWITHQYSPVRILRIRFYGGRSLDFDQQEFWGLEEFHKRVRLKRKSS